MISYMISYILISAFLVPMILSEKYDIIYDIIHDVKCFYDIICTIVITCYFFPFLRPCHMILPMISDTYHIKIALISMT